MPKFFLSKIFIFFQSHTKKVILRVSLVYANKSKNGKKLENFSKFFLILDIYKCPFFKKSSMDPNGFFQGFHKYHKIFIKNHL